MNLRTKTLIAIGITFACFFVFMTLISLPMTLGGLDRLEQQESLQSVLQTKAIINAETSSLQSTSYDWAWWDDMNLFVQGRNPDFAAGNLNRQSLVNLNANLLVVTDRNATICFSMLLSPNLSVEEPVPPALEQTIISNPRITNLTATSAGLTGLLLMPEGPMIIAASPILPSSREGPANGTFIIGRYMQSGILARVAGVTDRPVLVYTENDTARVQTGKATLVTRSGESSIFIIPRNESVVSGVIQYTDLSGRDILVVTNLARDIHNTGLSLITQFFILFVVSAIVVAVVVSLVLDRAILKPIEILISRIVTYEKDPAALQEPILSTGDELSRLENTIITASRNLAESERRFRYIVETSQEGVLVIDRDFVVTFANDRLASMLGYDTGEIIGMRITRLMPADEVALHDSQRKLRQLGRGGEQYECHLVRKDGTRMWAIVSTTPLQDGEEYAGSFAMITDITDRKRTEEALRIASNKLSLLNAVTYNEIRNATFVMSASLSLEKKRAPAGSDQQKSLEKQLTHLRRITESLDFANNYQSLGVRPPIWQDVAHIFLIGLSHIDPRGITRRMQVEGLSIFADPLLETVFFSLAENVIQHGGTATELSLRYTETQDGLILVFEDNGAGIPAEMKERIFERRTEQKHGMGLFLVREILGVTGISITETGVPGQGARFEMTVQKGAYRLTPAADKAPE